MHMLRLSHAKITIRPDIPWFNDEKLKGNDDKLRKILICATLKPWPNRYKFYSKSAAYNVFLEIQEYSG